MLELTHASGHEHPCQYKMSDIEMNTEDARQMTTLENVYSYGKVPVTFRSMEELVLCKHLGGVKA